MEPCFKVPMARLEGMSVRAAMRLFGIPRGSARRTTCASTVAVTPQRTAFYSSVT